MSKAEEEANKRYSITRGDDTKETSGIDMQRASDFIDGYHQAEKDLELSCDDICEIMEIREDVLEMDSYENLYEEILKRFKERKQQ